MLRRLLPGLCLFAAACGPDLDACEALELKECDIAEQTCQEHYSAILRCIRGDDQPTPKLEVLTADEYRERYPEPVGAPASDDAVLVDRGLTLLGLGASDPASDDDPQVPSARYLFDKKTVLVIDETDVRSQLRALSQAHADAAIGGFPRLDDGTLTRDQSIATVALFLGETIFYGDAAWFKNFASEEAQYRETLGYQLYYGNEIADAAYVARLGDLFDHAAVGSAFAVGFGPDAVLAAYVAGGPEAIRAAYATPIDSTAQFLRGTLAEPTEIREWTAPGLPDGLRAVAVDRLGPWLLHTFQARAVPVGDDEPIGLDIDHALHAAENWRGDQVVFIHDPVADKVGVILEVAVDDPTLWSPAEPGRETDVWQTADDGRTLTLVRADSVELKAALIDAVAAETRLHSAGSPPRAGRLPAHVSRSGPGGGGVTTSGDAS